MEERLRIHPNDVAGLANYAGLKMRMGHLAEALETTNRALEIEPGNEDARFNRALICAATRRWDLAQQDFAFLLARTGAKRRVQCLFGLAGVYFEKSNHVDSLQCYTEYLSEFPTSDPPTAEVQTARIRVRLLQTRLEYERLAQPGFFVPGTGRLRH
jgi:tetratricopeptide (TPR) repeat protein